MKGVIAEIHKIQARKSGHDYLLSKGWRLEENTQGKRPINPIWKDPRGNKRCGGVLTALKIQAKLEGYNPEEYNPSIGYDLK